MPGALKDTDTRITEVTEEALSKVETTFRTAGTLHREEIVIHIQNEVGQRKLTPSTT